MANNFNASEFFGGNQLSGDEYREVTQEINDTEWSLHSWVLGSGMSKSTYDELQEAGRRIKFTDTSIGGSLYLNRRPQASIWSDFNEPRLMVFDQNNGYQEKTYDISFGMGRYFSEQIDDMQSLVHLRVGTVSFTSMFGYMLRSYDPVLDQASRDSMVNETMFRLGQFVGFITGSNIMIQGSLFIMKSIDAFLTGCSSEYATCKPNMVIYWRRVQTIFDSILTAMDWRPDLSHVGKMQGDQLSGDKLGKMDDSDFKAYNETMRDIFTNQSGAVDLRAMVTRPMRAMYHIRDRAIKQYEKALASSGEDFYQSDDHVRRKVVAEQIAVMRNNQELADVIAKGEVSSEDAWKDMYNTVFYNSPDEKTGNDFENLLENYTEPAEGAMGGGGGGGGGADDSGGGSAQYVQNQDMENNASNINVLNKLTKDSDYGYDVLTYNSGLRILSDPKIDEGKKQGVRKALDEWNAYQQAEWNDGSAFLTFAATGNATATDSFNNTAKEPLIKSFLASMGSRFRDLNNSTSGYNIIPGMDAIIGGVTSFIKGHLDGFGVGGLAGLFSQATPVIPDLPDSSSSQMQTVSLTLECRSPYGTKLSRISNQYITLAACLALVTPYSSGYQSYGSPPVIEYYQKGFSQSRFGIVDSMVVTRGVGNKGWDRDGGPLGMTIQLELKPLAKDIHFPIVSSAVSFRGTSAVSTYLSKALYDSDNVAKDYIAVIAATDPQTQIYTMNKIRRNWQNAKQNIMDNFTKASVCQSIWDFPVLNLAKTFSPGNYLIK